MAALLIVRVATVQDFDADFSLYNEPLVVIQLSTQLYIPARFNAAMTLIFDDYDALSILQCADISSLCKKIFLLKNIF